MRRIVLFAGIGVAVILLLLAGLLAMIDVNQYRPAIQAALQKQLKRPITLGNLGLKYIPLSISVQDVVVGESPAFNTGRPFATAKEVRVRVALLPLLRKDLQIDSFVLEQPSIELVRNTAGKWNYSEFQSGSSGGGSGSDSDLSVYGMEIRDGTIAVTDLAKPKSRATYDHIDLALKNFAPGKQFDVTGAIHLPGSGKETVTLAGTGGPVGGETTPFQGKLTFDDVSLAAFNQFLSPGKQPALDGVLTGSANLESAQSIVKARGNIEVAKPRVRGAELGYPIKADFDLADNLNSDVLSASSMKVQLGKIPITMSGQMDTKAATVDGRLKIDDAELADLLALARAFGDGGSTGSGRLSLNVRVQGPLDRTDALNYSGTGSLQNAQIGLASLTKPLAVRSASLNFDKNTATLANLNASLGSSTLKGEASVRNFSSPDVGFNFDIDKLDLVELQQLTSGGKSGGNSSKSSGDSVSMKGTINVGTIAYNELAFTNVHSDCTMSRGVLTMSPLTATLFGGKQNGSITLDTRAQPPKLSVNTKMEGVDADKLLSATTSIKKMLYGLLAAGGDANMTLQSGADMARSLNGNLNIHLTQGKLVGFNLLNEMSSLAKFLGYSASNQGFTNIVQLAGDVAIRNGIASTENLQLQTDGGTVASSGTVNLADQTLNLHVTTVLDNAMSQKAGGSQIGGFMTTALANNKGELVIPALVTGTFAHPRFMPDAGRVAEMKLKNLLPTAGNPGALTTGLLGALKGDKGAGRSLLDSLTKPQDGANKQGGGGSLFDVIDSLHKKDTKSTQPPKK